MVVPYPAYPKWLNLFSFQASTARHAASFTPTLECEFTFYLYDAFTDRKIE